jgi:hypothetical protein
MRIFFYLWNVNHLRVLGPVIDAGLQRGHTVYCIIDERSFYRQFRKGKGVGNPWKSFVKMPNILPYKSKDHLIKIVEEYVCGAPICAICALPYGLQSKIDRLQIPFVYIQYLSEIIVPFFPTKNPDDFKPAVWLGMSQYWKKFVSTIFLKGHLSPNKDVVAFAESSFVEIGAPEFDSIKYINADDVRNKLGLSHEQKVVLLASFPYKSNPKTFAHARYTGCSLFARIRQSLKAFDLRLIKSEAVNDRKLCNALRTFCDENNAVLIVKSRAKDPIPAYLRRIADFCFYDPSHYPATILELLAISDLAISFRSSTAFEAVRSKVPHISIDIDDPEVFQRVPLLEARWNFEPDASPYNYPGASRLLSVESFMEELKAGDFSSLAQSSPDAQRFYIEKFLGKDDCKSGERAILEIERICSQK